jgi:prepilin-type N-terminal cleavage/methylation domain-containing protein
MNGQRKRRGFSLGEILVAVAIIAVIAAVVIPSVGSQLKTGDESRMQQDVASITSAAEQFLADVRRYPKSLGQLIKKPTLNQSDTALVGGIMTTNQIARWRGPYLTKDSLGAIKTGFDVSIDALFTSEAVGTQNFLTISLLAVDTTNARNIDVRSDDSSPTTGMIRWSTVAATTTLKFHVLPVQ